MAVTILVMSTVVCTAETPPPTSDPTTTTLPALDSAIDFVGDFRADAARITDGQSVKITIGARVAPAMTRADFARYKRWLVCSDQQASFVDVAYEAYRQDYAALLRAQVPDLIIKSSETHAAMRAHGVMTPAFTEGYVGYLEANILVNRSLNAMASRCFDQIKPILTEEQMVRFDRVRSDRDRRAVSLGDRLHYPSAADLIMIVESMRLDDGAMIALDPVMMEYERRLTPIVVRLERQLDDRQIPLAKAYGVFSIDDNGQPLEDSTPAGSAIRAQRDGQVRSLLKDGADLQEFILRVNKEFLAKFQESMLPDEARRFLEAYRLKTHPDVYPDIHDLHDLQTMVMAQPAIAGELRRVLEITWAEHRKARQAICDAMERESDRYFYDLSATQSVAQDDRYREVIRSGTLKRLELSQRMLEQVHGHLPPETRQSLASALDAQKEILNRAVQETLEDEELAGSSP